MCQISFLPHETASSIRVTLFRSARILSFRCDFPSTFFDHRLVSSYLALLPPPFLRLALPKASSRPSERATLHDDDDDGLAGQRGSFAFERALRPMHT